MSVDTLRETFHINRVSAARIQDFLTAQTYRPEITRAKERIRSLEWEYLQDICSKPIRQGKSPVYSNDGGLICVKPRNTKGVLLSLQGVDYIESSAKSKFLAQRLMNEDIVITRSGAGTIGRVSVFLGDKEVYTNDHLFIVRVSKADSCYICAFLNSYWGQRLLEAGVSGSTGQLNLSHDHINGIMVFVPDGYVQKYIGDKMRQAERLRAWAAHIQSDAEKQLSTYGAGLKRIYGISYRASVSALSDARLDPSFYHPERILLEENMKKQGCHKLGKYCSQVKSGWDHSGNCFAYFEIGGLDISTGTIRPSIVRVDDAPSRAKTLIKSGDILVSTVRPNRKNVAIVVDDLSSMPMVATSGFSVLRFHSQQVASFFHAWLRTEDATSQLMRWNSGSAYPAIDDDVPFNIQVPDFDESLVDELGGLLFSSCSAITLSEKLIVAAKIMVEGLIEGRIGEIDLVDAQECLQRGDNALDKNLIGRLKVDGVDGSGESLFADVDQLYDLLEKVETVSVEKFSDQ